MTRVPVRFRLRSLFVLLAIFAVFSEFLRWAIGDLESPFLVGLACFSYGGIAGLLTFASTAAMSLIASPSPTTQRIGFITGSALSTFVWLIIVVVPTLSWFPVCAIYSALVVALMALLTRSELAADDGISPENTLQRLRNARAKISSDRGKTSTTKDDTTSQTR